jgi:hypothetical protein
MQIKIFIEIESNEIEFHAKEHLSSAKIFE